MVNKETIIIIYIEFLNYYNPLSNIIIVIV